MGRLAAGKLRAGAGRRLAFLVITVLAALAGCTPLTQGPGGRGPTTGPGEVAEPKRPAKRDVWPPRAIWVVRRIYDSPQQIADLMDRCCDAGFNTVLFQVRGEGTAYYPSKIEPYVYERNGQRPLFDPLEVACREAHRRGLALHAWVNVMPAWKGRQPPADPRQLYNAHPDWFWYDQKGQRQPLDDFYVSLNPCLPEVRQYLTGVFREIVERYSVDGLHMDYIRFPSEECPRGSDYPYDAKTIALYRKATGKQPKDDRQRWMNWRIEQVTQLVRDIRFMMNKSASDVILSAACGHDVENARERYFQDGSAWLRGNLVDLVFVMNYTANTMQFRRQQEVWMKAAGRRPVAPGIGVFQHPSDAISIEQLKLARQWGRGFAIFSSSALLSDAPRTRQRLEALRPLIAQGRTRP